LVLPAYWWEASSYGEDAAGITWSSESDATARWLHDTLRDNVWRVNYQPTETNTVSEPVSSCSSYSGKGCSKCHSKGSCAWCIRRKICVDAGARLCDGPGDEIGSEGHSQSCHDEVEMIEGRKAAEINEAQDDAAAKDNSPSKEPSRIQVEKDVPGIEPKDWIHSLFHDRPGAHQTHPIEAARSDDSVSDEKSRPTRRRAPIDSHTASNDQSTTEAREAPPDPIETNLNLQPSTSAQGGGSVGPVAVDGPRPTRRRAPPGPRAPPAAARPPYLGDAAAFAANTIERV